MIRHLLILLILLTLKSQAQQLGFSMNVQVSSPAVEFSKLQDEWVVDHHGTYAYAAGRLTSWLDFNGLWQFGVSKRADYLFQFSTQTAQFYSRLEHNQLPPGKYTLDLQVSGLLSQGVFARRIFSLGPKGQLGVTLYGLQGSVVQLGTLTGEGEVFQDNSFQYEYELDYYFDHSRILDSPEVSVSGYGYALDLDLEYNLGRHWALKGIIRDMSYQMYWSQINRDKGCVARPTSALCSGKTTIGSNKQRIQRQSDWMIYGLKGLWRPFVQWQSWGRNQSWIAGVLIDKYSAGWGFEDEVVNFTYDSDRLQVKWAFDNITAHDAHHWQLTLGTVWPIF